MQSTITVSILGCGPSLEAIAWGARLSGLAAHHVVSDDIGFRVESRRTVHFDNPEQLCAYMTDIAPVTHAVFGASVEARYCARQFLSDIERWTSPSSVAGALGRDQIDTLLSTVAPSIHGILFGKSQSAAKTRLHDLVSLCHLARVIDGTDTIDQDTRIQLAMLAEYYQSLEQHFATGIKRVPEDVDKVFSRLEAQTNAFRESQRDALKAHVANDDNVFSERMTGEPVASATTSRLRLSVESVNTSTIAALLSKPRVYKRREEVAAESR